MNFGGLLKRHCFILLVLMLTFSLFYRSTASAGYVLARTIGGPGQFTVPSGITVDSAGNVWVADSGQGQIVEFSSSGGLLKQINRFGMPRGIDFDSAGNIWLANSYVGSTGVEEIATSGTQLPALGSYIVLSDKDVHPYGITFDSHGNLWVADTSLDRVIEFDQNGNTLQKFGIGGIIGSFGSPVGVAIDSADNVWVLDQARDQIDEFSPVPEPPSAVLCVVAGALLCFCQRQVQKN
jgi:tripartite motif-containing protein 71